MDSRWSCAPRAGRQRLEQALEERRGVEEGEEFKPIRRGWCLGEEAFRKELLAQMGERLGTEHYGEERAETAAALAERIIAEELKRRKWKASELRARAKGAPEKVAFAVRLRAETTMTAGWIAERLGMGTRGHLNHLLYRRSAPVPGRSHVARSRISGGSQRVAPSDVPAPGDGRTPLRWRLCRAGCIRG